MRGPEYPTGLVAERLADDLPARLTNLETRLALAAGALIPPRTIAAGELSRLSIGNDFPAILVVGQDTGDVVEVDLDDELDDTPPHAGPTWRVAYNLRVFLWAAVPDAGPGGGPRERQAAVDLLRKRYTLAVRETLMARPILGPGARLDAWWHESYSDIAVDDRAKLTLAASFLDVRAVVEETLEKLPAATYPAGPDGRTIIVTTGPIVD